MRLLPSRFPLAVISTAMLLLLLLPMPLSLSSPFSSTAFATSVLLLPLSPLLPLVPMLHLLSVALFVAGELAIRAYPTTAIVRPLPRPPTIPVPPSLRHSCDFPLSRATSAPRLIDWHCLHFSATTPASPRLAFDGHGIVLLETRNSEGIRLVGPSFEGQGATR